MAFKATDINDKGKKDLARHNNQNSNKKKKLTHSYIETNYCIQTKLRELCDEDKIIQSYLRLFQTTKDKSILVYKKALVCLCILETKGDLLKEEFEKQMNRRFKNMDSKLFQKLYQFGRHKRFDNEFIPSETKDNEKKLKKEGFLSYIGEQNPKRIRLNQDSKTYKVISQHFKKKATKIDRKKKTKLEVSLNNETSDL